MEFTFEFLSSLFMASLSQWYVIVPAIVIGLIIGAIPGLGPANSLIILLSDHGEALGEESLVVG